MHPEFFPGNLVNDIALLRLDSPVDLRSPHIATACLPDNYDHFAGHRCWVCNNFIIEIGKLFLNELLLLIIYMILGNWLGQRFIWSARRISKCS